MVGTGLPKSVFPAHTTNGESRDIVRKRLLHTCFLALLIAVQPERRGHESLRIIGRGPDYGVRLIPPIYAKPFVKRPVDMPRGFAQIVQEIGTPYPDRNRLTSGKIEALKQQIDEHTQQHETARRLRSPPGVGLPSRRLFLR